MTTADGPPPTSPPGRDNPILDEHQPGRVHGFEAGDPIVSDPVGRMSRVGVQHAAHAGANSRARLGSIGLVTGGSLMVLGSLLPWVGGPDRDSVSYGFASTVFGTDFAGSHLGMKGGDALVTLLAGVALIGVGIFSFWAWRRSLFVTALVGGAFGLAWSLLDISEVGDIAGSTGDRLALSPGPGLWIVLLGSLLAITAAMVLGRGDAAPRPEAATDRAARIGWTVAGGLWVVGWLVVFGGGYATQADIDKADLRLEQSDRPGRGEFSPSQEPSVIWIEVAGDHRASAVQIDDALDRIAEHPSEAILVADASGQFTAVRPTGAPNYLAVEDGETVTGRAVAEFEGTGPHTIAISGARGLFNGFTVGPGPGFRSGRMVALVGGALVLASIITAIVTWRAT